MRTTILLRNTVHVSRLRHARGFASSSPRGFGFEVPIEVTAELLRSIHNLSGLSYGVTIPLTAIALRSIITLPLSIYSQKKLNRRIELRPLFFHWGNLIGVQAVAQQKARNVDLRGNLEAYTKMMSTVQKMVPRYFSHFNDC
jgi:inner membrane protein COX18